MHIRSALDEDLERVLAVERAAFAGEAEADLVRALLADPSAQPTLSLLALGGERAVGHILFSRGGQSRLICARALDRPEYWRE